MCTACEFRSAASGDWTMAGASTQADRMAVRARTESVLGRVLATAGLHVACAPGDIRLGLPTGAELRLREPGEIWAAAEALTGKPFDPLAPAVLALGQSAA